MLIKQVFNSLKLRVIASAIVMSVILLPLVGLVISTAYEKHMHTGIKNELTAYSYAILAVADVENKQLNMPEYLLENQFNMSESGLYALFTSQRLGSDVKWRSNSLLTLDDPSFLTLPKIGDSTFYQTILNQQTHFIYSFTVSFEERNHSSLLTLHILKERQEIELLLSQFQKQLWIVLFVLMVILISIQLVWLRWSLKPLVNLQHELRDIEQGNSQSLKGLYPQELSQVTQQLNTLLQTEHNQRTRYRNALSDLAHSLKTPLAVIQSHDLPITIHEQANTMNKMIDHQLKKAQSAGQVSWHLGVNVAMCVKKLQSSLVKIYQEKSLKFTVNVDELVKFKGEEADLYEILGNLLDNAAKAAKTQIALAIHYDPMKQHLVCIIEDDGEGIADNVKASILQRGIRADTYHQGHGIGLAIVRDLVESYEGELQILQSEKLNGAKFLLTFPDKK